MRFERLTRPPFVVLRPDHWFIVRLGGEMMQTVTDKGKEIKGWPVEVYSSGPKPMPKEFDLLGHLQNTPQIVLFPNNMTIEQTFKMAGAVGSYYLVIYSGQKMSGMNKFNLWDMVKLELEPEEIDTLGHDPIIPKSKK